MSYTKSYTKNKPLFEDIVTSIGLASALSMFAGMDTSANLPKVKQVIFNPPATIVNWSDGSKTVAMCSPEDKFNEEFGFAMACAKKLVKPYETFQDYLKNAVRTKKKPMKKQAKKHSAPKPDFDPINRPNINNAKGNTSYGAVNDLFKLLANDLNDIAEINIKIG